MRRILITVVFLVTIIQTILAQKQISEDAEWTLKERGYLGLGLGGLSFGNHNFYGRYFSVGAGALAGYMLTQNLSTGVGFDYQYTSYGDQKLRTHVYGGYPFVRYNIRNFFVQFDYDFYWLKANVPNATSKATQERFFGGIGFSSQGNGRVTSNFLISYDFLYTSASLFGSPLSTRLFFTF